MGGKYCPPPLSEGRLRMSVASTASQLHCVSHSMADLQIGHLTIKAGMPPASSVISMRLGINFSAARGALQLMHTC